MLCLIKNENIFGKFCRDIYTIKYQKHGLLYIHLLIFLYSNNQFFEAFQIDEIICAELLILETNSTKKLIRIVTSVMLYGFYRNINPYSPYMNNA